MGINLGAFLGPLVTGYLAQDRGFRARLDGWGLDPNSAWHWGFGAAGVGMALGLVQYVLGGRALGTAGLAGAPGRRGRAPSDPRRRFGWAAACAVLVAVRRRPWPPASCRSRSRRCIGAFSYLLLGVPSGSSPGCSSAGTWTPAERKRLYLIVVFFVAAALFWSVFEQAGSTLNLFADRSTDNSLFGYAFPSSWWQSLNAMFIFVLAPVFAWLWLTLGRRGAVEPTKFALGLFGVGLGFLVLVPAAQIAVGRREGRRDLAVHGLPDSHVRRTVPEPGRPELDDQARARAHRQPDDGRLVPGASVGNFIGGQAASFYETMPLPTPARCRRGAPDASLALDAHGQKTADAARQSRRDRRGA